MGKDGFFSFNRWFFESIDIVPQERGIHADRTGELGDVDFLVGQEELLHRRRLGVFINEALETDVFVDITPMDAVETEGILLPLLGTGSPMNHISLILIISFSLLLVKVLVPLGDDDVCILINDSLDLLEVTGLDAHPLHNDKLRPVPFELGHPSIPLHMDMQRVMLPTVEEERESEESEYFWHNVFFINYYGKDRNYFQYPQRIMAEKVNIYAD